MKKKTISLLLCCGAASILQADDYVTNPGVIIAPGTPLDWGDPNSWLNTTAPPTTTAPPMTGNGTDNASILHDMTFDTAFGGTGGPNADFTVGGGSFLNIDNAATFSQIGTTAWIRIGQDPGTSTVNIVNGTFDAGTATRVVLGIDDGVGEVNVGPGSTFSGTEFHFGSNSEGNVTVVDGATVSFNSGALGYEPGSSGSVTMTGGTFNTNGWMGVGRLGNGSFRQSGGTFNAADNPNGGVWTGEAAGITGTISHSGTSIANYLGDRVLDGNATGLYLGRFDGTTGLMEVSDTARVQVQDRFAMSGGPDSNSSLALSGSAAMTVDRGHVGYNGQARLQANDEAVFTTVGTFFVFGEFADGDGIFSDKSQLNISNPTTTFVVGVADGSAGSSLTLNGSAKVTHAGGRFIVGRRENTDGLVVVNEGAMIESQAPIVLGETAPAVGRIFQTGTTSVVETAGDLSVSDGSLYSKCGGDLNVGGSFLLNGTFALTGDYDTLPLIVGATGIFEPGCHDLITGASIGTANIVSGDMPMVPGSTYRVTINDTTDLDVTRMASGTFDAGDSTLDVTFNDVTFTAATGAGDLAAADRYGIVVGDIAGDFGNSTDIPAADLTTLGLSAGGKGDHRRRPTILDRKIRRVQSGSARSSCGSHGICRMDRWILSRQRRSQ